MVEIFVLQPFCDWICTIAERKGRKGSAFRRMALVSWCLGEVIGLFIGLTIAPADGLAALLIVYLCALLGAGIGAALPIIVIYSTKTDPINAALTAFPTIGK